LNKSQPQIVARLKQCLKKWAEGDFKNDPALNLIPSMYQKMKSEGHDFTDSSVVTKKAAAPVSKDPNVVASQQEEDDIAKAIELSLKEKDSPKAKASSALSTTTTALYPTMSQGGGVAAAPLPEPRKVRALYDFEAAEDNELTFLSGEIIMVLDDSDPNWWKGQNQRGEGLFPSNFVSADLNAEPEPLYKSVNDPQKTKKSVQFSEENAKNEHKAAETVEVNEMTLDRLLHLLHEADPEDPSQDTDEMLRLEAQVNLMGPLIDSELERVDRKHAQLTQLSSDLVDSINLYHTLMRESDRPGEVL
jgi:signal transducing adaptor molecule